MSEHLLAAEEVRQLTGYVYPTSQMKQLTKQGIRFYVDRFGRPQVPREVLSGPAMPALPHNSGPVPNLDFL